MEDRFLEGNLLGHLDLPATVDVGVMCCSPEATFRDFRIGPPISRDGLE